jgi:Zn-dependent peptidase ImmA (M78 family)
VFARGFKSWCETISLQYRRALKLQPVDPLDPGAIAKALGVRIHHVQEIPGLDSGVVQTLLRGDPDSWSAVTITNGRRSVIILNSSHRGGRSASDLMHELAHIVIGHEPARVDITEDGALILNTYNREQEDQANWLAGCLLLPRDALLWIKRQGLEAHEAAKQYGVSLTMLEYRLNVTGVEQQLRRTRAWSRRRT